MPIDYSKFDNIDDSDEEAAPSKPSPVVGRQGAANPQAAPSSRKASGGYPAPVNDPRVGNGRETLEPKGFEDKLSIVGRSDNKPASSRSGQTSSAAAADPMLGLAEQLERMAGGGQGDAGNGGGADANAEAPKSNEPQVMCVRADGRKKLHTTYPDGAEMVEEFDERTDMLLLRKTRKVSALGKPFEWVWEVGQAPQTAFDPHADLISASSSNPIFLRKDTPEQFQWRIRNLPYAQEVFSVTVDHEKQEIVVRTSNKKYFKRIGVPDLSRVGLKLKDEVLTWKHQHNTLILSYSKPTEVLAAEQKALKDAERASLKM